MAESRICMVSGGTAGIGKGVTASLADAGHRVAFCGRTQDRIDAALSEMHRSGIPADRLLGEAVDIQQATALDGFVEATRERWGAPDVLVCNAGISPKVDGVRQAFEETPDEVWNEVLAVNLTPAFRLAKALAPSMRRAGFGRMVLIGSVACRGVPRLAGAPYVASNSAALTRVDT